MIPKANELVGPVYRLKPRYDERVAEDYIRLSVVPNNFPIRMAPSPLLIPE